MAVEVAEWIRPLLPDAERDPVNTCIKLSEEAAELMHALYTSENKDSVAEECADIMVLLLDIAFLTEVNLAEAFKLKMTINRGRVWNKEKGCLKHEYSNRCSD